MSAEDIVRRLRESRLLEERRGYSQKSRKELIELAQDGDKLALEILIDDHQDFIKKMSNKYIMDTQDRDDIIQLATIAFWDAVMKWDMTGDFEAYAGMIIKRKMVDELRKDSTNKNQVNTHAQSMNEPVAGDDSGESSFGDTLPSKSMSPEDEFLGIEGAREIRKFLEEKLSDSERDVIRLYIEGMKVSQISEELGMKYKSAENALKRVKDKLAEYMRNSYKESKRMKESSTIEFSDEEKKVLNSILNKIDESKHR